MPPSLDSFGSALKKLIAKGKELGYITIEELNQALPSEKETSDQIEDIMAAISDMEISIISADETEDFDDEGGETENEPENDVLEDDDAVGNLDAKDLMRSDDPVRMYLKEMGTVELLSREGEIAIAKRIEAGKTVMIGGLCENPMTLKAISKWRDELVAGTMQLRNIIDLEMMYGVDSEAIVYDDDAAPVDDDLEQVTKELESKTLTKSTTIWKPISNLTARSTMSPKKKMLKTPARWTAKPTANSTTRMKKADTALLPSAPWKQRCLSPCWTS